MLSIKDVSIEKNATVTASHIYVRDTSLKKKLASDIFEFMNVAYKYIGGFRSFTGEDDFIDESFLWYITYEGQAPQEISNIDINKVYTVAVFKQKYGMKMVGIGNNRFIGLSEKERKFKKDRARYALDAQIKFVGERGWAEVSGACEAAFRRVLSPQYIIEPEVLVDNGVFKDIEISPDHLHYVRKLSNGMLVEKIAYGRIRI